MKNASTFFIQGTRALVDHAAAAALISGAGRRSWPQHGPGAARHLIRRNGQGFPCLFCWRLIYVAAATVQGALASRMQDDHVVIQIQCSLIPCRGRQAPRHATRPESAQASRDCTHGRASIAFVYTRPLAWAMPWNPMPYGERAVPHRASRSRQEPPELHQEERAGVSPPLQLAACLRAAQRPRGRPDAAPAPAGG